MMQHTGVTLRHMDQGVPDPARQSASSNVHEHVQRVSGELCDIMTECHMRFTTLDCSAYTTQ
jgi:hypothetical protein